MSENGLLARKKGCILFGCIGFLFVFFVIVERDLAQAGNIVWTGGYLLKLLAVCLFAGGILGSGLCFLVYVLAERKGKLSRQAEGAQTQAEMQTQREKQAQTPGSKILRQLVGWLGSLGEGKFFLAAFLLIALCWLPCYLAYYPAICAYDANVQTGQVVEGAYNDHHPIAHTLLIGGAMKMGAGLFGNVNAGIAVYGAVQLLLLAGALAFGIGLLRHFGVKPVFQALLLLYGAAYPFHWYMSVSVIKDTVFSIFFLLQMLALCGILLKGDNSFHAGWLDALFGVCTVGMILFRNNGRYAMIVLLVFLLFALWRGRGARKLWGRLSAAAVLAFIVGNVLLSALFRITGAQQGDKREMLSMPIQQMARCMIYHGGVGVAAGDDGTMDEDARALINDFLLDESYREYRPDIADPVKRHTNTYVPRYRLKEFASVYLRLFAEYPGEYVNAALAVNAGYLSPGDVSHAFINENGVEKGLGYVQTRWVESELNPRGIYKDTKWKSLFERLENWADGNAYLDYPVLKYIFVPGTYLWLYLLLAGSLVVRKRFRMLLPLSLVLGYYITLFLGPTVQLRYLYPLMLAFPFAALILHAPRGKEIFFAP